MSHLRLHRVALAFALTAGSIQHAAGQGTRAQAPPGADSVWTRIAYISGETVYLEVGRQHGLTERSTLDVVRAGATIARLRVTALASSRAAGEVLPPVVEVAVGDSVRFVPSAAATAPAVTPARTAATARARATAALRGRLGIRYLVMDADGGGFTQPAYDLRLDGDRLGGSSFGVSADVRAQRTQFANSGTGATRAAANATRVYQAAVTWTGEHSGLRVAAGRQLAGALTSVGIFDGVGVDLDRARWSAGGFVGSQPADRSFGLSGRVREHGIYGGVHTRRMNRQSMALTVGGVGSYVGGAIDREYAFARLTSNGPRLSLYATQELDFNRGWKRAAERAATTPTATFASVHFAPTRAVSLFGGFDNRRSVRLYRDYQNPELAFDDAFREGTWGGVSVAAPRNARLSVDRRDSRGGIGGSASSTTVMASISSLTRARLGFRLRGTSFSGTQSSGRLWSGAVEVDPWGMARIEANGGQRSTTAALGGAVAPLTWWGVDADISIGRSLYLLLSTYREFDVGRTSTQTYASFSWRF